MSAPLPLLPGRLAAPFPVLLLPVGVQVKFMQSAAGTPELWVRIYPDQLSISTHEAPLTPEEVLAGADWHAHSATDPAADQAAYWRALVARFGAPRAQWLVRQTDPRAATKADTTATRWSRAAEARGLPHHFLVALYRTTEALADVPPSAAKEVLFPGASPAYAAGALPSPTTEFLTLDKWQEGLPIGPGPLAVGFSPDEQTTPTDIGGVDVHNQWTVDFPLACQVGMGLKIDLSDLSPAQLQAGIARLVVLGVRPDAAAAPTGLPAGQNVVAALLTDHYYTSGVQLVPQGTPTNNTDTGPAGYSSAERTEADATLALLGQDPVYDDAVAWDLRPDGHHLARALGLPDAAVPPLPGARTQHDTHEAVVFNRALWPATYGYFLEEMLRPLLSPQALDWMRAFFENYVQARGVAPALRVGAQPYGVLATTRFSAWEVDARAADAGYAAQLQAVLGRLDATWTERLNPQPGSFGSQVTGQAAQATFAAPAADPGSLLTALGLDATSTQYYQRYLIGPLLAEALSTHAQSLGDTIWTDAQRPAGPYDPRDNPAYHDFARLVDPLDAAHLRRDATGQPVAAPPLFAHTFQSAFTKLAEAYPDELPGARQEGVLIDAAPLSETALVGALAPDLPLNYVQWLATASFDDIRLERFGSQDAHFAPPNSLLYRLLRQAVLLAYWEAAKPYIPAAAYARLTAAEVQHDAETFNIEHDQQVPRWAWLYKDLNGQPLYVSLAKNELKGYLAGVAELGGWPTARLERLLAEHLDLGSYRLDAWRLAPVAQRLRKLRDTTPVGSHLGAFGWLENLRPQDHAVFDTKAQVYDDPDSLGYLHAPGQAQATTAALLRQGYKSRQLTADPTDPVAARMAVEVSSGRVRAALALLEGLRGGHSLGTLLGQRFERAVQAHAGPAGSPAYASYLPLFRNAFPLSNEHAPAANPGQPTPTGTAPELAARQVVDGAALLRAAAQHPAYPHGLYGGGLPAAGSAFALFITSLLAQLTDELDALGDLGLSEGIFQAARGNTDRATAVLDGLAKGQFPPVPDVVHPPQATFTLTQRVLVQLPAALPAGSGWPAATPRALAAPRLNAWLAQFMPGPAAESWQVGWRESATQWPLHSFPLAAPGLHPIDLLYLVDEHALQDGSDLDRLLRYQFGLTSTLLGAPHSGAAAVAIDYTAGAAGALRRLLPLLARLRQLLASTRPALPHDLQAPGRLAADEPTLGVAETTLGDTLATSLDVVGQLLLQPGSFGVDDFYQLALYGVAEALPGLVPGADLAGATRALRTALALRLATAPSPGTPTVADRLAQAAALFGPAFRPDVEFTLADPADADPARRAARQAASAAYQAAVAPTAVTELLRQYQGQPLALQEWLHGLGAVREPLNHLDKVFLIQSLLYPDADTDAVLGLRPAQLVAVPGTAPDGGGDYWLGLAWPTEVVLDKNKQPLPPYAPPGDALSLVQWLPAGYQAGGPQCALWLDEWAETLPAPTQPTAVALHYDQPNSAAPQAMLLVVPPQAHPQASDDWTTADLLGALNETLDLAKKRTVEPAALAATPLATVLPAVVAPVAQQAVTLTLDLGRLNGTARFRETPLTVPTPLP